MSNTGNLVDRVSGAAVLGNASFFCAESALRCKMIPGNSTRPSHCGSPSQEWYCPANEEIGTSIATQLHSDSGGTIGAGLEGVPPRNPYIHEWLTADIAAGSDGASLVIDASGLNGTGPVGVKYAYDMPKMC